MPLRVIPGFCNISYLNAAFPENIMCIMIHPRHIPLEKLILQGKLKIFG